MMWDRDCLIDDRTWWENLGKVLQYWHIWMPWQILGPENIHIYLKVICSKIHFSKNVLNMTYLKLFANFVPQL